VNADVLAEKLLDLKTFPFLEEACSTHIVCVYKVEGVLTMMFFTQTDFADFLCTQPTVNRANPSCIINTRNPAFTSSQSGPVRPGPENNVLLPETTKPLNLSHVNIASKFAIRCNDHSLPVCVVWKKVPSARTKYVLRACICKQANAFQNVKMTFLFNKFGSSSHKSLTVLIGVVDAWIMALTVTLKAGDAAIAANSDIFDCSLQGRSLLSNL
jgi:hypothetical protein